MDKPDTKSNCPHHWLVDAAGRGVCRLCGATKKFVTSITELLARYKSIKER